jgi:uncharacterized membrane protein YfcA
MTAASPEVAGPGASADPATVDPPSGPPRAWLLPAGAAIAFLGSMAGVGGGLFTSPLLTLAYRFPLRRAIATSLVLVMVSALVATATEVLRPDSRVLWSVAVATGLASLVGAEFGFVLSNRLAERRLRQVFVWVLALAGARVFYDALLGGPLEGGSAAAQVRSLDLLIAALAGLGGGVISPLLGIGGGLLVVPALYLFVPAAGFQEARACSLAVMGFTAARSLWLHARVGRVSFAFARWLAPGAVVGAVCGVLTVKRPGFEFVGQLVLGTILWLVAARFVRDLRQRSRS